MAGPSRIAPHARGRRRSHFGLGRGACRPSSFAGRPVLFSGQRRIKVHVRVCGATGQIPVALPFCVSVNPSTLAFGRGRACVSCSKVFSSRMTALPRRRRRTFLRAERQMLSHLGGRLSLTPISPAGLLWVPNSTCLIPRPFMQPCAMSDIPTIPPSGRSGDKEKTRHA